MAIPKEVILLASLLLFANLVTSYPSGAGKQSCRSLRPRHNKAAQTGTGSYVISVPPDPIIPGSAVTVILSGDNDFKGFLVQARKVGLGLEDDGSIIGTWESLPKDTQYRNCDYDKSAVTHASPKGTKELKLVWRAPSNLEEPVQFRATFVQSYSTFWVALKSAEISHALRTPTTVPAVTTAAGGSDCGPPPRIQHEKDIKFTTTGLGSTAQYSCLEGFKMVGNEVSVCIPDERWYPVPYCKGKGCGNPSKVLHAKDPFFTSTDFGATVKYECEVNYHLTGSASISCQTDGRWSTPPTCSLSGCGKPPDVLHAKDPAVTSNKFGATIKYECEVNYKLSGSATITCQSDGRWNPAPKCSSVQVCGQPPQISHGKTIWNFVKSVGSKAVCTCNEGFVLDGSYVITCISPGVWSAMPNCKEISKQIPTTTKEAAQPVPVTKSKEVTNTEKKSDTTNSSDDDDTTSKSTSNADDDDTDDDDDSSSGSETDETDTDETDTDETDTDETDTDETDTDETDTDETDTDETDTNETDTDETDTDETETDETETDETEIDETETDETETDKTETDETETDETDTDETDTDETETDETETDETETDETETDETETDETETDETETDETETDESDSTETESTESNESSSTSSSQSSSSGTSSSSSSGGKKSHRHIHSHHRTYSRHHHGHGTKSYGYTYRAYRYKRSVEAERSAAAIQKALDYIQI